MKTTKFRLLATIITLAAVIATTTSNAQRRSTSDNNNDKKVETTRTSNKSNIEKKNTFRDDAAELKSATRSAINKEIARADMPRRSTGHSTGSSKSNDKVAYNSNRAVKSGNSERYNHNSEDARYKPNKEYKGSNKNWSSDFRTDNRNNHHSAKKYNYNKYNHWDRNWEGYRWNSNSWRNYYGFYNPYSYRNNKYYYHHNYYGHVIRKFDYRPQIYVHNHTRYYSYDGYFFRYRSGVGYVLVDIPFGMAFEYLPNDYERVYVNGYLYFRIGNLFFEYSNYGYQLVHYPERYFAYNDGYRSEGFRFNDMNY